MEHPLNESAWRRGWQDTKTGWKHPLFWALEVIVSPIAGILANNAWVSVLVVFVGVVSILIGATARAPIVQRNEARGELLKKPILIPLPNRTELIKSMAGAVNSAYKCWQLKYIASSLAESKHPNAHKTWEESERALEQYGQAREKLNSEALVAGGGKRLGGIMIEVQKLISILDRAVSQFFGDKRPDIDVGSQWFKFDIALGKAVRKLDEISQSTSHKEGYQN